MYQGSQRIPVDFRTTGLRLIASRITQLRGHSANQHHRKLPRFFTQIKRPLLIGIGWVRYVQKGITLLVYAWPDMDQS
jgi:hypothetical protein